MSVWVLLWAVLGVFFRVPGFYFCGFWRVLGLGRLTLFNKIFLLIKKREKVISRFLILFTQITPIS
jgi:hypothetical protein